MFGLLTAAADSDAGDSESRSEVTVLRARSGCERDASASAPTSGGRGAAAALVGNAAASVRKRLVADGTEGGAGVRTPVWI